MIPKQIFGGVEMKTFAKVISVALVAVMLLCVLSSCATRLNGTYESKLGTTLTFKGEKVTYKAGPIEINGTYEINDDEITLKLDGTPLNGTFNFEKDGKTITIGLSTYTKK
jgi:hypothetical protein